VLSKRGASPAAVRAEIVGRLRELEEFAYSVAHYLLEDAALAAEATRAALLEAALDAKRLVGEPLPASRERIRKLAARKAIALSAKKRASRANANNAPSSA